MSDDFFDDLPLDDDEGLERARFGALDDEDDIFVEEEDDFIVYDEEEGDEDEEDVEDDEDEDDDLDETDDEEEDAVAPGEVTAEALSVEEDEPAEVVEAEASSEAAADELAIEEDEPAERVEVEASTESAIEEFASEEDEVESASETAAEELLVEEDEVETSSEAAAEFVVDEDEAADDVEIELEVLSEIAAGEALLEEEAELEEAGELSAEAEIDLEGVVPLATPLAEAFTNAEEEEPVYHYRVSVALRPDIETQLNMARQTAKLPIARPGLFALQMDFQTDDLLAVVNAVRDWVVEYLPLTLTVERVTAQVIGEHRYQAGYALTPEDPLLDAQEALVKALAEYITPIEAVEPLLFEAELPVSDFVPVEQFPVLIQALQERFKPQEWRIGAVEVLRVPEGEQRWEVVEKIATA